MRMCDNDIFEEIPNYGDVYEMNDFIEMCEGGTFIDYDGFAEPIVDDKVNISIRLYPSEIKNGKYREFKKVCWYNK